MTVLPPFDLSARVGREVLRLFRADATLRGHFLNIESAELEDLVRMAAGNLPVLAILIQEVDRVPIANDLTAELKTVVDCFMLHRVSEAWGSGAGVPAVVDDDGMFVRARLAAHMARVIYGQNRGALFDPETLDAAGQPSPITEALTRASRVPFFYRFSAGVVATPVRFEFRSWESLVTGRFA